MKIALTIIQVLSCLFLIAVVLLQQGKKSGLGVISGAADTFLAQGKARGIDEMLAKATTWVAIAFILLTLSLSLVH